MKTSSKKITAVLLAMILCCSCFLSVASAGSQYGDYDTYVLLGDSVASGYNDIDYLDTEFVRVDHSYAAIVADTIGAELIPMACPGFRTVEMRYILEDDYEADQYLFNNVRDKEVMEQRIPEIRKAIAEAELITLGLGGNDFGTFLTWVLADIMENEGVCAPFVDALRKLADENSIENANLETVIELADTMGVLPEVMQVLPRALEYGISGYFENWDCMIEDIYALNPDVELLVIGMFDTAVKSADDTEDVGTTELTLNIGQMIVDMANEPMIEGAEKYGYTFVDTTGTTCDTYHPNYEGHQYIAEKILDALEEIAAGEEAVDDAFENMSFFAKIVYIFKNLFSMILSVA